MTNKFNVGKLTVLITHSEEHFNTVCQATIPEYWEAEIVNMSEALLERFEANNDYTHLRLYGTDQFSEKAAIQDLVDELQKTNVTGMLNIIR